MDFLMLKNEILNGPLAVELAPFVASGSDAEITRRLNDPKFTRVGVVTRKKFSLWAAVSGVRGAIQMHVFNQASPLHSSALSMTDLLQGGADDVLDIGNPAVSGMLSAWVAAGAMTEAQRDELVAMAEVPASRADILFGGDVSHEQVGQALRG